MTHAALINERTREPVATPVELRRRRAPRGGGGCSGATGSMPGAR